MRLFYHSFLSFSVCGCLSVVLSTRATARSVLAAREQSCSVPDWSQTRRFRLEVGPGLSVAAPARFQSHASSPIVLAGLSQISTEQGEEEEAAQFDEAPRLALAHRRRQPGQGRGQ